MLRQTGDKELTVQLADISSPAVAGDLSFAARIIPDREKFGTSLKRSKENLLYRMDSCFYLQKGAVKVYSQLTQTVANGLSVSFDYLVTFDIDHFDEQKWNFIYLDKYLNKKKYTIKLTD